MFLTDLPWWKCSGHFGLIWTVHYLVLCDFIPGTLFLNIYLDTFIGAIPFTAKVTIGGCLLFYTRIVIFKRSL